MKISIAQTRSLKGKIAYNVSQHLQLINLAVEQDADLIIFPEMSITNFEPQMASEHVSSVSHDIFKPFQDLANVNEISIGIGMPTKSKDGINISMLIFQAHKSMGIYSKQILHSDEYEYFVCGTEQMILNVKGMKIAIGICYETMLEDHFAKAHAAGFDVYVASVAKSKVGIDKAFKHFPRISSKYATPILMSNCVGHCDTFMSVGNSAVWNKNGDLLANLDSESQGLITFETETQRCTLEYS